MLCSLISQGDSRLVSLLIKQRNEQVFSAKASPSLMNLSLFDEIESHEEGVQVLLEMYLIDQISLPNKILSQIIEIILSRADNTKED